MSKNIIFKIFFLRSMHFIQSKAGCKTSATFRAPSQAGCHIPSIVEGKKRKSRDVIPSESHELHKPHSLQIRKANSILNFDAEIYTI